MQHQLAKSFIAFVIILSFVSLIYHVIPGFHHMGAANGDTSWQPTNAAISLILFLFAFTTAVQMTPKQVEKCPHCGASLKEQVEVK
jgi:ABC-type phosphate transport system permease subunit